MAHQAHAPGVAHGLDVIAGRVDTDFELLGNGALVDDEAVAIIGTPPPEAVQRILADGGPTRGLKESGERLLGPY